MSFRLGAIPIGGSLLAALAWPRLRRLFPRSLPHLGFAAVVAAAGAFMSLGISEPVWSLVPPLRFVQFPWRFLILPAITMPLLCGAAAAAARAQGPMPRWALALLCLLIVGSSWEMLGFAKRVPLERIGFSAETSELVERDPAEAETSPTRFTREFVRRAMLRWLDHLPPGAYSARPPEDPDRPRAKIARGEARLEWSEASPARHRMRVSAEEPSLLRLDVHRFPGWTWRIDGRRAEPALPRRRRPVLAVEVPAGDHEVEAVFERTAARWAGDLVSLAALGAIALLTAAEIRGRRRGPGA
jgi:hypothetical protein